MTSASGWPVRRTVVLLAFFAVVVCYLDRVNLSVAIIPMAAELGWNLETQGRVLSAFFVGYLILQIAGGRMADRVGGKLVLGIGVLLWSFFTMLTPAAAYAGLAPLLLTRIGLGLGEAVTFPSIYTVFSRWVPLVERSRAVGVTNSGIPFGTITGLLMTPYIVRDPGWPWAFYLFGGFGLLWLFVWQRSVTASPADHPRVTPEELAVIEAGTGRPVSSPPPWSALFANSAVWALIIAHFCNNWSLYVLLSWLPTFVNKGLGVNYAAVGVFTMMPNVSSFVFFNLAGSVADRLISRGMDVGRVRKLMMTIAFGGLGAALAVVGYVHTAWMAIAIMSAGTALGSFVVGGFSVNHMDIAPRHAGTLMGITNTAGTIPGVVGVYVTGVILQATGSWTLVFQLTAAVTIAGLVVFLLFGSGRRQFD
jgi:ACS family sodium-dependent inorganic phosphate cotransporter